MLKAPENKSRFWDLLKTKWNPQPINPPKIDPELEDLTPLQRSAEVIHYSILSIEFWISPNGQVREWVRHNSRLSLILAVPAFLILPIVTFALWQLVSWLVALVAIAGQLIVFPLLATVAVIVIWLIVQIIKTMMQ